MIIFILDINTPLSLQPGSCISSRCLYLGMRNGLFFVTGIIIVLIAASYFISVQDMSPIYALLNRQFFSCMFIASDSLIWNYKKSEESLKKSEKNTAFSRKGLRMRCSYTGTGLSGMQTGPFSICLMHIRRYSCRKGCS